MGEDTPALHLSGQELWQYSQAVVAVSALAGRLRVALQRSREHAGRLAFDDAEHAARLLESRRWPPVRLMTDAEVTEWRSRVPAALASPLDTGLLMDSSGPPVGVCAARMVDAEGDPTGEWGVEAHARGADGRVESVFLVCRDPSDAVALSSGLRRDGSVEQLRRLRDLATGAHGAARGAAAGPGFGEREWVAALRAELPQSVAEQIIPTSPGHGNGGAWEQLVRLAGEEVDRVGADPRRLAALVGSIPRWNHSVRDPAALAHWAITQARAEPGYLTAVTRTDQLDTAEIPAVSVDSAGAVVEGVVDGVITPPSGRPVDPAQAAVWAAGLDSGDAEHRVAAKVEFGRWGAAVDRALAQRFPGLVTSASDAADRARRSIVSDAAGRAVEEDPLTRAELMEQVARMDPARAVDRRAAHVMLGRVPPEIDQLLAAKFGHDPAFADKFTTFYPHGLPPEPTAGSDRTAAPTPGDRSLQPRNSHQPASPPMPSGRPGPAVVRPGWPMPPRRGR